MSLEFRLKCVTDEFGLVNSALRGKSSYGGTSMLTATETEKEDLRAMRMSLKKETEEIEQQLKQQQQQPPHQAPPPSEHSSGPPPAAGTTTTAVHNSSDEVAARGSNSQVDVIEISDDEDERHGNRSSNGTSSGTNTGSSSNSSNSSTINPVIEVTPKGETTPETAARPNKRGRPRKNGDTKRKAAADPTTRKGNKKAATSNGGDKDRTGNDSGAAAAGAGSGDDGVGVTAMTRSNVLRRRVKQEGPSPETTSSCVDFRTELAWQKSCESIVAVVVKMWGVRGERSEAKMWVRRNVKNLKSGEKDTLVVDRKNDETEKLVERLRGTAEHDFDGVLVHVKKVLKVCQDDEDLSTYLLGDKDRVNHVKRVAQQFESYTKRCNQPTSKAQLDLEWLEKEEGQPRRGVLTVRVKTPIEVV